MKVDECLMPFELNDEGNMELQVKVEGKEYILELTKRDLVNINFVFRHSARKD